MGIKATNPLKDTSAGDSPSEMGMQTVQYAVWFLLAMVAFALALFGFRNLSGIVMDEEQQPWSNW